MSAFFQSFSEMVFLLYLANFSAMSFPLLFLLFEKCHRGESGIWNMKNKIQPISGRVDRASANETVRTDLISSRVKPKNRGGVEDTRPRTQKNSRPTPRTDFPRTVLHKAKDRNDLGQARDQGNYARVFFEKKKFFTQKIANFLQNSGGLPPKKRSSPRKS